MITSHKRTERSTQVYNYTHSKGRKQELSEVSKCRALHGEARAGDEVARSRDTLGGETGAQ